LAGAPGVARPANLLNLEIYSENQAIHPSVSFSVLRFSQAFFPARFPIKIRVSFGPFADLIR
jgi:hypothetical protein